MTGVIEAASRPDTALPLVGGGFRPDVQALRGVAVLLVVAYHAQVVPGGFVGVDVFFVISGFVIGRSLVARLQGEDSLSLRQFSARRVRRLLPALAVMVTAVVLLAPLLAPIGAGAVTGRTGMAASLLHANFFLFRATRGGYFGSTAEWNPLLHTWSLSVEEQFYLVLPVTLLGLWRWARRSRRPERLLRVGVGLIAGVSLVWSIVLTAHGSGSEQARWAFFASPTRAWEFLLGLGLVLLPRRPVDAMGHSAVRLVGLGLVLWSSVGYSDSTSFPGIAALVPVAGAGLFILGRPLAATATEQPRAWARPLQFFGDLSYSWYLWHWPLIVAVGAFWPLAGRLPLIAAAVVSLVPAWASYTMLERRYRTGSSTSAPSSTLRLGALCVLVPVVASVASIALVRWFDSRPQIAATVEADRPHLAQRSGCNRVTPYGSSGRQDCTWGDGPLDTVLIGDSNADQFSDTMVDAVGADQRLRIAVLRGCPIADVQVDARWFTDHGQGCRAFVDGSIEALVSERPDVVVISNATDKYIHDPDVALVDPLNGRRASTPRSKATLFEEGLQRSITRLTDADIKVALIETVPKPWSAGIDFDQRSCSSLLLLTRPAQCAVPPFTVGQTTVDANDLERRVAAKTETTTWDLGSDLCPDQRCGDTPGITVWPESQHIGVDTARQLAPAAQEQLRALLAERPTS